MATDITPLPEARRSDAERLHGQAVGRRRLSRQDSSRRRCDRWLYLGTVTSRTRPPLPPTSTCSANRAGYSPSREAGRRLRRVCRTAEQAGASATDKFTGNQVAVYGDATPDGGLADVYLDGVKQLVGIDCWNPKPRPADTLLSQRAAQRRAHAEDRRPGKEESRTRRAPRSILTWRRLVRRQGHDRLRRRRRADRCAADGLRLSRARGPQGFGRQPVAAGHGVDRAHRDDDRQRGGHLVDHALPGADRQHQGPGALPLRRPRQGVHRQRDRRAGHVPRAAEVRGHARAGHREELRHRGDQRQAGRDARWTWPPRPAARTGRSIWCSTTSPRATA